MSYILEALRRAEAERERERGQVPGLHTQTLPGSEAAPAAVKRRWLPWAGSGLLLLAGIGAGSWWASGQHEAAMPVPQPMPAPVATTARPGDGAMAPVTEPVPSAPPGTQQGASAPMPQPAASGSPFLPPAPPPVAVTAAPAPQLGSVAAPPPAPVVNSMPAPVLMAPRAPVAAPAAEASIPRLSELPESTRRELPKLAIAGSVYSDDPASRLVIVNGEVLREGAHLGADLVLEQIRPHELVLRFKGQRYRQPI